MDAVNTQESVSLALRSLYRGFGYLPFKVTKFEEYDLYAQNKSFLTCKQVLTFSNTDGRLMALKPDVTLSIIRSAAGGEGLRKVYYNENVYRVPGDGEGFREIPQTGLECIGELDICAVGEVVALAAKSLAVISERWVLDVSHMGVISGVLEAAGVAEEDRGPIWQAVSAKNASELSALCGAAGVMPGTADTLQRLTALCGPLEKTLSELGNIPLPEESLPAVEELRALGRLLRLWDAGDVQLDFSVVNDAAYYSGIVFRGFIDGVASGVLAGGQYDNLIKKMGRPGGAIGFAVYLDQLERFWQPRDEYDADALILYTRDADIPEAVRRAGELRAAGESVRVQRVGPAGIKCRREIVIGGSEVCAVE